MNHLPLIIEVFIQNLLSWMTWTAHIRELLFLHLQEGFIATTVWNNIPHLEDIILERITSQANCQLKWVKSWTSVMKKGMIMKRYQRNPLLLLLLHQSIQATQTCLRFRLQSDSFLCSPRDTDYRGIEEGMSCLTVSLDDEGRKTLIVSGIRLTLFLVSVSSGDSIAFLLLFLFYIILSKNCILSLQSLSWHVSDPLDNKWCFISQYQLFSLFPDNTVALIAC